MNEFCFFWVIPPVIALLLIDKIQKWSGIKFKWLAFLVGMVGINLLIIIGAFVFGFGGNFLQDNIGKKCFVNYVGTTVLLKVEGFDIDKYCYDRPMHDPPLEIVDWQGNGNMVCKKWVGAYRYTVYDWDDAMTLGKEICANLTTLTNN